MANREWTKKDWDENNTIMEKEMRESMRFDAEHGIHRIDNDESPRAACLAEENKNIADAIADGY